MVRPLTRIGLASEGASTQGPFVVSWYWYPVTVVPPEFPGVNAMARLPSPVTIEETVGAAGTPGVVTVDGCEAAPVPLAEAARSAIVYCVPSASPLMVIGLTVVPAETQAPPFNWYW